MPVTTDQMATLRAYFAGDADEFKRLNQLLDRTQQTSYATLIAALFVMAVFRHFDENTPREKIIEFVSDVRSRSEALGEHIDPALAERIVLGVFNDDPLDDVSGTEQINVQLPLALALIADERLDTPGLDRFMSSGRDLANRWLGAVSAGS